MVAPIGLQQLKMTCAISHVYLDPKLGRTGWPVRHGFFQFALKTEKAPGIGDTDIDDISGCVSMLIDAERACEQRYRFLV